MLTQSSIRGAPTLGPCAIRMSHVKYIPLCSIAPACSAPAFPLVGYDGFLRHAMACDSETLIRPCERGAEGRS